MYPPLFLVFPLRQFLDNVLAHSCYFFFAFLQVFVAISLILGDGLYNLIKIISVTIKEICTKRQNLPVVKEVTGKNYVQIFEMYVPFVVLADSSAWIAH